MTLLPSDNVDIKYIGGADPEMLFLDEVGNEVEVRICVCMFVCCVTILYVCYAFVYTYFIIDSKCLL